jgi:hypothetical protein
MKCKQARAAAIEQVRAGSAVLHPHFAECAECARFLHGQLALQSALEVVSREVAAPANLEDQLLTAFAAASRPPQRGFRWWIPAAALAASLALAAVALRRPVAVPAISAEPFIEIPYIAPLAPYERTSIVRMDIPASALIAAGFDVHSPDTGAAFTADVLFGQDGRARAIRLVSNSIPNSNRRIIQ